MATKSATKASDETIRSVYETMFKAILEVRHDRSQRQLVRDAIWEARKLKWILRRREHIAAIAAE